MTNKLLVLALISFSFFLYNCGDKSDKPQDESSNKSDLENFADKMKDVSENFNEGKKVNPVDFRELKALLPETIGNLKRTNLKEKKLLQWV